MTRRDLLALTPALLLTGCDSDPKPVAEKKPAEPVTGLHALYQSYGRARVWAPDAMILRLSSIDVTEVKPQPGKAAAWQTLFASASLGQRRAYTFSVYDASVTLRLGVFPDAPGQWSNDNRAFLIAAAKTDTDAAWEVALKHGADYAKKNPTMPISYTLEKARLGDEPVWRVIWGESASSSSFSVLVDASTGQYVETLF